MKYVFVLCFSFFAMMLTAQTETDRDVLAREATTELARRYGLTAGQQAEMMEIQERRFRNLAEIEVLRETDYALYLQKKKSVRLNTEGSIRRMLTDEQRVLLDEEIAARRRADSDKIRQYRQEGKSKEEIQQLLLEQDQ